MKGIPYAARAIWLSFAIVCAITLPRNASGSIDKCQAELGKRAALFHNKVALALQKCADAIRKEQVKNIAKPGSGFLVLAAARCQKELNRILDLPGVLGGKSERDKFFTAVANAFSGTTPKCTLDDLRQLGFLPSGSLAPGTDPWDFATVWLAASQFHRALQGQLAVQGEFLANLQQAILAPSKPPGTSVATVATNCSLSASCNPTTDLGCRPDLCRLGLTCRSYSCAVDTGAPDVGLRIDRPGAAVSSSVPSAATVGLCALQGLGYPLGGSGEGLLLAGEVGRSLPPLAIGGKNVCVDILRVAGYCACAAPFTNWPKDVALCQDRLASNGDACPGSPVPGSSGPDPLFPTTTVGPLRETWSDATSSGDCVALATVRVSVVASGGEGADGQPCTVDDLASLSASSVLQVPLTTGQVTATLADAVSSVGSCSVSGSCLEDANCSSGQTCSNPPPILAPLVGPSLSGAPLSASCANFQTGQLAGLQLVTSFPLASVPLVDEDAVVSVKLACQ